MKSLKLCFLLCFYISCEARKIGLFDFYQRDSVRLMKDFISSWSNSSLTIDDIAAAVFKGEVNKKIPPKMTICSSIFADLDAGQLMSYGSMRAYPTWAFVGQDRKMNLSLSLGHQVWHEKGVDKIDLNMGTAHPNKYLGML